MLVKLLQSENVAYLIFVIFFGITILLKLVQLKNAHSPIYVTLSEIVILFKSV